MIPTTPMLEDIPVEERQHFVQRMLFELKVERQRGNQAIKWALETLEAYELLVLDMNNDIARLVRELKEAQRKKKEPKGLDEVLARLEKLEKANEDVR